MVQVSWRWAFLATVLISEMFLFYLHFKWFFFPLGIILSAEFFWFIGFSFYLWLSFMLYISGHFCLVVRHCKFVGYCIFLSSCQCFWDFSGSQLSYSVKFDSSGICFLSFWGGSRAGLNLGLVSATEASPSVSSTWCPMSYEDF